MSACLSGSWERGRGVCNQVSGHGVIPGSVQGRVQKQSQVQAIAQVLASILTNSWIPLGGMYVCGVLVGGGGGGYFTGGQ